MKIWVMSARQMRAPSVTVRGNISRMPPSRIPAADSVEDFETIEDPAIRAAGEVKVLRLARSLMIERAAIGDITRLRARVEAADTMAQ